MSVKIDEATAISAEFMLKQTINYQFNEIYKQKTYGSIER